MKKSLIAVAVAGLFAAPAAMADVTISGAINVGINVSKTTDGNVSGSGLTNNSLSSGYSHIEISSSDDIGNGNKVVFQYSMNLEGDRLVKSGNAMGNRNSFLGIAGTWGAFKMGTNENVYERFMYTADPMDGALGPGGNLNLLGTPGGGTIFDVNQSSCDNTGAGCAGYYRRADNVIWYESPNFNGFSFEVDYTLSAGKTATTDPKILSIGGKWAPEGLPFYIDAAYEKHDDMFGANTMTGNVGGTGSSDDAIQIGAGYTIGDLGLHARWEKLSYSTDGLGAGLASEWERDAFWFGVKYNLPSGYIGAEVGVAGEADTNLGSAADTGAKLFGIGYFHNLSKQSQVQFMYGRTDNDSNATYGHAGTPGNTAGGADHQVFHVGIKHTF